MSLIVVNERQKLIELTQSNLQAYSSFKLVLNVCSVNPNNCAKNFKERVDRANKDR